jgi:hypothetical protein
MTPTRRRTFGANGFGAQVRPLSLGKPAAVYPAAVAGDSDMIIAADLQLTSLAVPLNATDNSMSVVNPTVAIPYSLLTIDSETVKVTGAPVGSIVPIVRGFDGTAAAPHQAGAAVSGFIDAYHHNRLVAEVEAIEQTLGPNLSGVPTGSAFVPSLFPPQTPGGSLVVGNNSITLSPVPKGVNGSNQHHYLYISGGTGTPEAALITGGSAVSGAPSGTVIVNCAHAHSGAWTIQTATAGVQEAIYASPPGSVIAITQSGTIEAPIYVSSIMAGRLLTGYSATLTAASGFALPSMMVGDAALSLFTLSGLTLNANGQTAITTIANFSRPENSIRDQFVDFRIIGGAQGATVINLDGCEDTSLVRFKSESHVAAPITDVAWHVPGGNIHILGATMFNMMFLSFQVADIVGSTVGTIVMDGAADGVLIITGGYLYANAYGSGVPGNFFTTGSNAFDSISIIGTYITCALPNTVVFQGQYERMVNVTGCIFDSSGASGVTVFSAATMALGEPLFVFAPRVMLSGASMGTPAAGVQVWEWDPVDTVIEAATVNFTGSVKVNGSVDWGGATGAGTVDRRGIGAPNGVVVGYVGDTYRNVAGGAGQTLWVKESGTNTNTGWVGK